MADLLLLFSLALKNQSFSGPFQIVPPLCAHTPLLVGPKHSQDHTHTHVCVCTYLWSLTQPGPKLITYS